jgi:hypothetical protein
MVVSDQSPILIWACVMVSGVQHCIKYHLQDADNETMDTKRVDLSVQQVGKAFRSRQPALPSWHLEKNCLARFYP